MPLPIAFKCLHDCGRSFASENACREHERDCKQLAFLQCSNCGKKAVWGTQKAFKQHQGSCGKTDICKDCKNVIKIGHNGKNMRRHEALCKREKDTCVECHKEFYGDKQGHWKKCRKNPDRVKPLRTPRRKARAKLAVHKEAQATQDPDWLSQKKVSPQELSRINKFIEKNPELQGEKVKKADLESRSLGSGKSPLIPEGSKVERELLSVIASRRGFPHEGHKLEKVLLCGKTLEIFENGKGLGIGYKELVNHIKFAFPTLYEECQGKNKDINWYDNVRNWCTRKGISLRKANRGEPSAAQKDLLAARCEGTLLETEKHVSKNNVKLSECANIDETSMAIFVALVVTLHWMGAKDVPSIEGYSSRLNISMPIMWYGDGTMDFIVVWRKPGRKKEDGVSWSQPGNFGIWWMEAPSAFTRKTTYVEILRFFLPRSKSGITTMWGDMAPGHSGPNADNYLKQLTPPCRRIRIQGGCTTHIQAADRPTTNGKTNRDCTQRMHDYNVYTALKGEFKQHKSLTKKARTVISEVLSKVKEGFETKEAREGIIQAFKETIFPGFKKHSKLEALREHFKTNKLKPIYELRRGITEACETQCEHGCGMRWKDEKTKKKASHTPTDCYPRRPALQPPMFNGQDPRDPSLGVSFSFRSPGGKKRKAMLVGHEKAVYVNTLRPLQKDFWKGATLKYMQSHKTRKRAMEYLRKRKRQRL